MIIGMDSVKISIQMVKSMKETFLVVIRKDMVCIITLMEIDMKDIGRKIAVMVKENKYILMVIIMREPGEKMKKMVLGYYTVI